MEHHALNGWGFTTCLVALLMAATAHADEVVARVQTDSGVHEISRLQLEAYLEQNPGMTAAEGAEHLVEFELLYAAADRSGLASHEDVAHARRQALVQRYLIDYFEPLWSEQKVPNRLVRVSYDRNRRMFRHPELRTAVHVVITQEGRFPDDEASAQAIAQEVAQHVRNDGPESKDAFVASAKRFKSKVPGTYISVDVQELGTFAQKGKYGPDFTEAVFSYPKTSGVVPLFRTKFGYHLVWLDQVIPARNDDFDAVAQEIRQKIVPEVRAMKLTELTDALAEEFPPINRGKGARSLLNPAALGLLELGGAGSSKAP